jgi:transcription initiation factor TFIIIB Brf1 subunit/transcription initiation factor TFIIB
MDNRDKILKAMRELGKPVKPGEVAKITRLDDKEVNKIFKELKSEGKIISPKRCFYSVSK